MIYSKTVSLLIFFIVFLSCSKDEKNISVNAPVIELETYFGTYLFKDRECSGYDIQYLTIDENGISFFDYLGDLCDNTNNCYLYYLYSNKNTLVGNSVCKVQVLLLRYGARTRLLCLQLLIELLCIQMLHHLLCTMLWY